MAAEGNLSVQGHICAEKRLLATREHPTPFVATNGSRVCLLDGGQALNHKMETLLGEVDLLRCERHLRQDIQRHPSRDFVNDYRKMVKLPGGNASLAERLLQNAPEGCPVLNVPKQRLCAALLPAGARLTSAATACDLCPPRRVLAQVHATTV